ncbi:MAG: hypothetical protein KBH45_08900 [Verrucomicrobia bacterium]|nr:hypothetical protein [Verrucomicrobiota bacterium]
MPVGATATVFIPGKDLSRIRESGRHPIKSDGVSFLCYQSGKAVFVVGSGSYTFTNE